MSQTSPSVTLSQPATASVANTTPASCPAGSPIPREVNVLIEGESEPVELEPCYPAGVPIVIALPKNDFAPPSIDDQSELCTIVNFMVSREGVSPPDAHVSIVWPKGDVDHEQAEALLLGDRGWAKAKGFEVGDHPSDTAYVLPWLHRQFQFQTKTYDNTHIVGELLLGELKGQGFWIVIHIPMEYMEGYMPRIRLMLQHLQAA